MKQVVIENPVINSPFEESKRHFLFILELQGMGKNMWKNIDAQEYVDKERASWNG
jgi:hypothetical protein